MSLKIIAACILLQNIAVHGQLINVSACLKTIGFEDMVIGQQDFKSAAFVSDTDILKEIWTPDLIAKSLKVQFGFFEQAVVLKGFQMILEDTETGQQTKMPAHGSQDEAKYFDLPYFTEFNADLTSIIVAWSPEQGIRNLIFNSKTATQMLINNQASVQNQVTSLINIKEGYRMIGLYSVDFKREDNSRAIQKLQFLFIDTSDVRCHQSPSPELMRKIAQVYLEYDTNEDGLVQAAEFNQITDELGIARIETPAELTLEEFQNYMISHGIDDQEPVPVDPKIVDPVIVVPEPVDPEPVDPTPIDPNPVDPIPVNPNPIDPFPVEPVPVDPKPVDPVIVVPETVDPVIVAPEPVDPVPNPIVTPITPTPNPEEPENNDPEVDQKEPQLTTIVVEESESNNTMATVLAICFTFAVGIFIVLLVFYMRLRQSNVKLASEKSVLEITKLNQEKQFKYGKSDNNNNDGNQTDIGQNDVENVAEPMKQSKAIDQKLKNIVAPMDQKIDPTLLYANKVIFHGTQISEDSQGIRTSQMKAALETMEETPGQPTIESGKSSRGRPKLLPQNLQQQQQMQQQQQHQRTDMVLAPIPAPDTDELLYKNYRQMREAQYIETPERQYESDGDQSIDF